MSHLQVRFDDPEHGWIGVEIYDNQIEVLRFDASDIYPSFHALVMALLTMRDARGEAIVDWMQEPAEVEMCFSTREEAVQLEISSFPGSARPLERGDAELVFAGTYDEICLPFWRALRHLEGRYTPTELELRWHSSFPHRELEMLTAQLGKD